LGRLLVADSVEEVRPRPRRPQFAAQTTVSQAGIGCDIGINLASFRRFWAVAARRNSSRAPFGPRSRSRSSLRMRLRWANNISTFLRSRRDARPSQELAMARACSYNGFRRATVVNAFPLLCSPHCLDASRQRTLRSTRRSDQVAARCPCSWIDLNRPSSKAAVLPGRVDRMNSLVERRSDQLCPIAADNGRNLVDVVDTCSRSEQSLDTTRRKHHQHVQGRIRWIAPGMRLAPLNGNA